MNNTSTETASTISERKETEVFLAVVSQSRYRETAGRIASEFTGHTLVTYLEHLLYIAYEWTDKGWVLRNNPLPPAQYITK
jgi:hypothetical protein